ncbi:polynucleotidyl transferase, ribonuclease H-like superfamily protein [Tanacetum coccineum]
MASPFNPEILEYFLPNEYQIPKFQSYDGSTDPKEHVFLFTGIMSLYMFPDATWCKLFQITLRGNAWKWFSTLPPHSISTFSQLVKSSSNDFQKGRRKKSVTRPVDSKSKKEGETKSCILEFDGVVKGDPVVAGAGVVIRDTDRYRVYCLRELLGPMTKQVAEYKALILGLQYALEKGFTHIRVNGDSKPVCMQVNGECQTKNQDMSELCNVVNGLKEKFVSFKISHVEKEYNTEADDQANLAVNGAVQEEVRRRRFKQTPRKALTFNSHFEVPLRNFLLYL